jgi:hypothetical protein
LGRRTFKRALGTARSIKFSLGGYEFNQNIERIKKFHHAEQAISILSAEKNAAKAATKLTERHHFQK